MQSGQSDAGSDLEICELEHIIGYNGKYPQTIHFIPGTKGYFVYSIGGLIVIEDVDDKHNQRFLRGHDMEVSALSLGSSGKILASGQLGTIYAKSNDAPVILWDVQKLKPINIYKGIKGCVTKLALSPDEKFLAAAGKNNHFYIWSTEDHSIISSKVAEFPYGQIAWGPMNKNLKHPSYMLVYTNEHNIFICFLEFDIGTMQYALKGSSIQLPSSGLVRTYTCAQIDAKGEYLYAGTTGGEVCVFNLPNQIFKAALPVSSNGVYSVLLQNDAIFVGSGDGRIKKLRGQASKYQIEREVILDGTIVSQGISNDGGEILAGSSSGKIYRVMTSDLTSTVNCEGHVSHISEVAFRPGQTQIFATIDHAGLVLVWDIDNLVAKTRMSPGTLKKPKGTCLCIADDNSIVTGWEDGFIRAFEVTDSKFSPLKWEIVNSHRGAVTSLYCDENYILSGGEDGVVRVWARKTHKMVTQIMAHAKTVSRIFPDLKQSNIIHSCSIDKIIHSYDLKTEKKVIMHQAKNGTLLDMTQRKDSELELVTCGQNNPITCWDCDVVEPVDMIDYPYKILTIQISPSGKFLAFGSETAEILIFEMATKKFRGKFDGHSGPVTSLRFTPDERQIISVSADASMCIWNFFE